MDLGTRGKRAADFGSESRIAVRVAREVEECGGYRCGCRVSALSKLAPPGREG